MIQYLYGSEDRILRHFEIETHRQLSEVI